MHKDGLGKQSGLKLVFLHKALFMNMPVAPESRSTDVEMDVSKVREVSSTWMLRE